jgi:hypothetical protein
VARDTSLRVVDRRLLGIRDSNSDLLETTPIRGVAREP